VLYYYTELSLISFAAKGTLKLTEFIHYFTKIAGLSGKVLIEHSIFGKRVYRCEKFNVVNDDEKIGLHLMGQDVYVLKRDVKLHKVYDKMYVLADHFLQLTIIVNEL
jgi:hypothetical protein